MVFSSENSGIVGGVSLIITIIGLIATLWGLRVTYVQLLRTKSVAEEVKTKANSIKEQVSFFDASLDLTKASKSLDQVIALRRSSESGLIVRPLEEAQELLSRLAKSLSADRAFAQGARLDSDYFIVQVQEIERSADKGLDFDSVELITRCRKSKNLVDGKLLDFQKGLYNG